MGTCVVPKLVITADQQWTKFKMADVEDPIVQYKIENHPGYTMNLTLFTDVTNSSELRQLIVQGKIEAALFNACMVLLKYFSLV